MTDYFRDLIARQRRTAEIVEPVMSHPFTGDTPAVAAVGFNATHLIEDEKMPAGLAQNLGLTAPKNR